MAARDEQIAFLQTALREREQQISDLQRQHEWQVLAAVTGGGLVGKFGIPAAIAAFALFAAWHLIRWARRSSSRDENTPQ